MKVRLPQHRPILTTPASVFSCAELTVGRVEDVLASANAALAFDIPEHPVANSSCHAWCNKEMGRDLSEASSTWIS